jgi:ligand-binding sensor domain-containing protein
MAHRSVQTKALAIAMSLAETVAASPLGTIASNGSVTVGNATASTGTTVFAGDKVTSVQPALINFETGSRIEMTKAAAAFNRQGKTIVVQADKGLLRFNFKRGESIQINAGKYQFTGGNDSARVGELGLDGKGQLVMNMTEGVLVALNTETGARAEVSPTKPLNVTTQGSAAAKGAGLATTAYAPVTAAIVAGVAAGVMVGVGIKEATDDKSPSSR